MVVAEENDPTLFSSPFLNQAYVGAGFPSASHSRVTFFPGSVDTAFGFLVNVGASEEEAEI